jgi:cation diffusion facilitator family transporter
MREESAMTDASNAALKHSHSFLGIGHQRNERKTWAVIWLCTAMMIAEIIGGLAFGSIALVADGLHMSTHAGALLLAALAYTYARRYVDDPRFTFGTGKLGDLAGFTSAIILAMIALLIGYEAVTRLIEPVPIQFGEAIAIASVGLAVNLVSAWLLGSGHDHDHAHHHAHHHHDHAHDHGHHHHPHPHKAAHHRDHNIRAAVVHVLADAAVSVLVIAGLGLAWLFSWLWMDALAGIIGAIVIASWSVTLIRDTGRILLDMTPDAEMADSLRKMIEADGDSLADLHLWRLGPGHLGAIVSVCTCESRGQDYYRAKLAKFPALSHLTIEVQSIARG